MNKTGLFFIGGVVAITVVLLGKSLTSSQPAVNQETGQVKTLVNTGAGTQGNVARQLASNSWYTDYSPAALINATTGEGRTVIFFHAGWCPTCQAAAKDFEANKNQIPADVTILKADYDTETELKQKYGVVMQDTFVQVDGEGNVLATWNSGGEGIKTLLAHLKSV